MSFIPNEGGLAFLLEDPIGPVGRDLIRRAEVVTRLATDNANHSGPDTLGIQSGDLHSSIHFEIERGLLGLEAKIGSPATHRGFSYPAYWNENGRPWLSNALRDGFLG